MINVHRRSPAAASAAAVAIVSLAVCALVLAATARPARALKGDCGIIVTNGAKPLASDCLGILQQAVSKTLCAPLPMCVCDVDGSGVILASDALRCLNVAVGNPAFSLNCDCNAHCDSTLPPVCGGECEGGGTCVTDPFDERYCDCLQGCELDSAPECGGDCSFSAGTACRVLQLAVGEFDPFELCQCIPPDLESCENSAAGGCNGACAPGTVCGSDGHGGCLCNQMPVQGLCETSSAPACAGTCGFGLICEDSGGQCQCTPAGGKDRCSSAASPACAAPCADGDLCAPDVGGDCACWVACELSPAPACGGECEDSDYLCTPAVGTVGGQSIDFCTCAPAPLPPPDPCDGSAHPACGGTCASGLLCEPSPWDENACTCLTPCEIDTYPSCSASCPAGSGTTCQAVTLEWPGRPADQFCYCLPPHFSTLCTDSAATGCDGTCSPGAGCVSDGAGACACRPSLAPGPCGEAQAPACAGICDDSGSICTFIGGGGCACLGAKQGPEPCGRAQYPTCAGACGDRGFCIADIDGTCACAGEPCILDQAPACNGECRPGRACVQYTAHVGGLGLDFCDCMEAP